MSSTDKRALSSEDLLQIALNLMERLTTAPNASVDAASFARDASISPRQMDEVIELLQGVADERSGAHIALDYQDGAITLSGDAGRLDPVRLSPAESLALRRTLTACNISDDVRERVEAALCTGPDAGDLGEAGKTMGGDRLLGEFYPVISEAIAIGARLSIDYRAGEEPGPSARLVDPKLIEVSGDAAYLVAWNVEKDAQRSYRLDRIARAEITDDSVERHDFSPYSAAESLRAHGEDAALRFASREDLAMRDWEGIHWDTACERDGRGVAVHVSYTSESWLFSQIVAAAGSITIEGPESLKQRFSAWARSLL